MDAAFVLTVIGPDRRGLVESLAQTVADHGGNWVQSRMASLAGQFAGLLWISVAADKAPALKDALQQMESEDLHITIQAGAPATPAPTRVLRLQLLGHDRPGLVRELTHALSARNINVEELASETYSAPMSGEPLFKATLELGVAAETDVNEFYDAFDQLADQLALDLTYDTPSAGE